MVVGRKNHYGSRSERGTQVAAVLLQFDRDGQALRDLGGGLLAPGSRTRAEKSRLCAAASSASALTGRGGRRVHTVYLLKERYRTEAAYREMKQELGLDEYEGRRYTGLNHHLMVVMCTYAFVVAERDRAFPPCAARAQKDRAHGAQAAAP